MRAFLLDGTGFPTAIVDSAVVAVALLFSRCLVVLTIAFLVIDNPPDGGGRDLFWALDVCHVWSLDRKWDSLPLFEPPHMCSDELDGFVGHPITNPSNVFEWVD